MRLLFISNIFPNPMQEIRGVFNLDMMKTLSREHAVAVVSPVSWVDEWQGRRGGRAPIESWRREITSGIEIYHPRYYYTPKVLRSQYGQFLWLSARGVIRRLLASHRPDIVLGYWAHPDGEVAVRAAQSAGIPSVVMVGGSDVLLLPSDRARRRAIRWVLTRASAVITVSRDLRERILDYGVPGERVHLIQRGVDPEKFSPGSREVARRRLGIETSLPVLLWVGRMVPVKGLDVLVEACSILRSRGVGFRLCLVGDGQLRSAIALDCQARDLADAVTFAGPTPHDRLCDWYRAADLTVLPSRSEGVPNVLRESLACGTPYVASRVGGVAELGEDPPNQLVPPEDPVALADAIARALQQSGPVPARPQSLDESVESLSQLLSQIVQSAENRPGMRRRHLAEIGP